MQTTARWKQAWNTSCASRRATQPPASGAIVMGREPIFDNGHGVGYVSSANTGYSIGKHIAYAYLPIELTRPGKKLDIEYFGQRLSATVAAAPLFDPGGARLRE